MSQQNVLSCELDKWELAILVPFFSRRYNVPLPAYRPQYVKIADGRLEQYHHYNMDNFKRITAEI